ncbi:MAG: VF530 family protein [Polaromonas sp.]
MVLPLGPSATVLPESPAAATVQPDNPLHGVKLEAIVTALAAHFGWEELGQRINIRCFTTDASVASSLKFLRKTPWARDKVEGLYLFMLRDIRRNSPTVHNFPPPRA